MSSTTNWTIRFPTIPGQDGDAFEIRPLSMNLTFGRGKYDQAKAKFPKEVGEIIKPHTESANGLLRESTYVIVLLDGEPIHALYFKPDFARYEDHYTHLEFHDLQESLDTGVIDVEWKSIKLRDAYEYVFERRDLKNIFNGIKFTDPRTVKQEVTGQGHFINDVWDPIEELSPSQSVVNDILRSNEVAAIEADSTNKLVDNYYAVDFDKISAEKAIGTLNKKFRVQTWTDVDRNLWVGHPEALANFHLAAPNDDRVWRYKHDGVQIRHPREPVKQVTVEGSWVDEKGIGGAEDVADQVISWFDSGHEGGVSDAKAHGTAYRTDIAYGKSLMISSTEAKRDALPGIAESTMRELMKSGHSGQIELDPHLSGDYTPIEHVSIGDLIHVVPDDKHFDNPESGSGQVGDTPANIDSCAGFVNNEIYFIKEVEHTVDESGYWSVTLDVGMYPDVLNNNMGSVLRYFDPKAEEWLTAEEFSNNGNWIESGAGS